MTNKTYRQEFRQLTNVMTVPVMVLNHQVVIGYNPKAMKAALES